MKKIPTVFVRDEQDRKHVTLEVTPGCEWVLAGEGRPTRKFDGVCVMLDKRGTWWARREVKPDKTPPPLWVEVDHDEVTGKRVGWEPAAQSGFFRWLEEVTAPWNVILDPGTYELCGPKVNGNPEKFPAHTLVRHGDVTVFDLIGPLPAERIQQLVALLGRQRGLEGIVWHHPDGRMAKLKARDIRQENSDGA